MSTPLIPQAFYFRMALPCVRVEGLPRAGARLLDLPEGCRLAEFSGLDGVPPWAEVRAAWNPGGLAMAFEVGGKLSPIFHDPRQPDASDGVDLWIDTRDTRAAHRATRFCHHFRLLLIPGKGEPTVQVSQPKIHRAQADAPTARAGEVRAVAQKLRKGYRLEVFFPASTLGGFDPETNRRLGLAYRVTDPDRGDQFLAVGHGFPVAEDPSLWSTLELRG